MERLIFAWSGKIVFNNILNAWRYIGLFLEKVINHFEKFYKKKWYEIQKSIYKNHSKIQTIQ